MFGNINFNYPNAKTPHHIFVVKRMGSEVQMEKNYYFLQTDL